MINWKTRIKHPAFWIGLLSVITSPVLAYYGAAYTDFTTWGSVIEIIVNTVKNPYLVGSIIFAVFGFFGVAVDPTTVGIKDSAQAMTYTEPKGE